MSDLREDRFIAGCEAAWQWMKRHPKATLRILIALALAASVWWLVVFPGAGGILAACAAVAAWWATVKFSRRPAPPVERPALPSVVVPPVRRLALAPPPVDGLHHLVVGQTLGSVTRPWTVNLLGASLFAAGLPGSGKSVFIRALMESMAEYVPHGLVQFWGLDPKMVEFVHAAEMFTEGRLWDPEDESEARWGTGAADLLEDAVREMYRRLRLMKARRQTSLTPTVETPFIVIFVDEVRDLLKPPATTDPKLKVASRCTGAIDHLCRWGRAPAISIVVATQEPRKDPLDFRDNVGERICFRVATTSYGNMVLYDDAAKDGFRPDRIKRDEPGVAFATVENFETGIVTTERVLAHKVDESALHAVAARYPAPRRAA